MNCSQQIMLCMLTPPDDSNTKRIYRKYVPKSINDKYESWIDNVSNNMHEIDGLSIGVGDIFTVEDITPDDMNISTTIYMAINDVVSYNDRQYILSVMVETIIKT